MSLLFTPTTQKSELRRRALMSHFPAAGMRSADTLGINRVTPTPPPIPPPSLNSSCCHPPCAQLRFSPLRLRRCLSAAAVAALSLSGSRPRVTPGGAAGGTHLSSEDGTGHMVSPVTSLEQSSSEFGKLMFYSFNKKSPLISISAWFIKFYKGFLLDTLCLCSCSPMQLKTNICVKY